MLDFQRFQQLAAQMGVQAKYKTVAHQKELDFDVSPEVKVARSKPPMEYDDKGNIKEYTDVCEAARHEAYVSMVQHAEQMGAHAIVGMRYDATEFTQGVTEVLAYGTAVHLARS